MREPTRVAGIIIKKNQILFIHRNNRGRKYYVFPGGGVEDDEDNNKSLLREISEETSIKVRVEKLLYKHNYETSNQFYYLCTYISGNPKLRRDSVERKRNDKGDDIYKPLWVDISKLKDLIIYPLEIRDWLIEDLKNNFQQTPREESLKVSELRQS